MGGPGRAQDLNYLNYLLPGPELKVLQGLWLCRLGSKTRFKF